MLLPKRHGAVDSYRYGFQGQEKDDEINGVEGSSYTADFWQYDSRLGRRWNPDPIVKAHESPYATFKNNPNYYVDPMGLNGEVKVDKENKKITVSATFYYNKNDVNLNKFAIFNDYTTKRGTVINSLYSEIIDDNENFFNTHMIVDDDGQEWEVSFNIEFVGKENESEVEQALKDNPAANKVVFDESQPTVNTGASWSAGSKSINIYGITGKTAFTHETAHGLGLPHAVFIPGSSFFGNVETSDGNGLRQYVEDAGLMSYASNIQGLRQREVRFMVVNAINLAKTVDNKVVNVFLSGFVYKNVPKDQLEKQIPVNPSNPEKQKESVEKIERLKDYPQYRDRIINN